jgi:hypothetical protein
MISDVVILDGTGGKSADKFGAETNVEIRQGSSVLQDLNFHTSCSVPLAVGDQFGSLLLTEFIPVGGSTACNTGESTVSTSHYDLTIGGGGAEGPQGPQGKLGAAGVDGTDGTDGAVGAVGADGAQGPQGKLGAAGVDGTDGTDGAVGAVGADGAQGPQGKLGAAGIDGTDGIEGATGPEGPIGLTGLTGEAGLPGEIGTDRLSFKFSSTGNINDKFLGQGDQANNWDSVSAQLIPSPGTLRSIACATHRPPGAIGSQESRTCTVHIRSAFDADDPIGEGQTGGPVGEIGLECTIFEDDETCVSIMDVPVNQFDQIAIFVNAENGGSGSVDNGPMYVSVIFGSEAVIPDPIAAVASCSGGGGSNKGKK